MNLLEETFMDSECKQIRFWRRVYRTCWVLIALGLVVGICAELYETIPMPHRTMPLPEQNEIMCIAEWSVTTTTARATGILAPNGMFFVRRWKPGDRIRMNH